MPYNWTRRPDGLFPPADGMMAIATDFAGATDEMLYVLGGWNPLLPDDFPAHRHNRIYRCDSQADLQDRAWSLVKKEAQWSPRHTFGCEMGPDDRLHVFGGDIQNGRYVNDHWSCGSAMEFRLEDDDCPWGNRVLFATGTFGGKILLLGGQTVPDLMGPGETLTHHTDIWGWDVATGWTQLVADADCLPRCTVDKAVELGGRLYIFGGGTYAPQSYNAQVWRSGVGDLTTWTLLTSAPGWSARGYLNCLSWDGKLWVVCGYNTLAGNTVDTWYSADGTTWTNIGSDVPARHAAGLTIFDGKPTLIGGNGPALRNDVYQLIET